MKTATIMWRLAACVLAAIIPLSPLAHAGARFLPLGYLDEGDNSSNGKGISADGATITGESEGKPYRWTESEGMVYLGDNPWDESSARVTGISGDSNVIFGEAGGKNFQWTQAAGYQEIFPGMNGVPYSISFDGSVYAVSPDVDVSADGTVTVGSEIHIFGDEAYRDAPNDCGCPIRQWLGDLPGGEFYSIPRAVSANGKVVVGQSQSLYDDGMGTMHEVLRPFYWTEELGMIALEPWPSGLARDVSANGLVVVGRGGADSANWESFRWTPATGVISIRELLLDEGIDVDAMGWTFTGGNVVSANGRFIVGTGEKSSGNGEAFLIELPVPGDFDEDGDSDGDDFLAWQRGESHHPMSVSDLDDWKANWDFFSTAAGASTSAVPEPGALLLGLMCVVAMFGVRFQK